ncbi:MAG: ComF family protein [Betaproteobacteria bacterium]|nr:ComF family protein [Betaproteobacteria bacterium]
MLKTLQALFAGSCFLCRGAASAVLCEACTSDLPRLPAPRCPRCALPSPLGAVCGRCLARPPAYDATHAALAYEFPADALIHSLKFRGELALAPLLGALLDEAIVSEPVTHVAAVPLSERRLRERGFNQSLEIARPMVRATGRRLALDLLARRRDTPAQFDLPWAERQKNVRDAFEVAGNVAGAAVAVVDDVMTTGATLDEIARALKAAGAARVVNWVVARTLPPQ